MIEVTRLNGRRLVINGDQIERIEASPDTILSMTSGRKLMVRESVDEMVRKLIVYRRSLGIPWLWETEPKADREALPELV
jgi:flagellar protein FlbD